VLASASLSIPALVDQWPGWELFTSDAHRRLVEAIGVALAGAS
jgi:hypothetical protein